MSESNKENKAKKARSAGQRIRDIKRLLENKKFQISEEKKIELEEEAKVLKDTISKNNSSYKKKLNKYLQYKKNKQKTMRFVELVKVKRKINQLQKDLVEILRNNEIEEEIQQDENNSDIDNAEGNPKECLDLSFSENDTVRDKILKIKSKILVYKRYEDYIRLLPFFKERKYIPLFSNTELDSEMIKRREEYINDVQELKEELRRKKIKTSEINNLSLKDSFLAQDDSDDLECDQNLNKEHDTLKRPIKKIEYMIGGNQTRNSSNTKKSSNKINVKKDKDKYKDKYKDKSNSNNYPISESETKTKIKPSNSHVIFSDSD
ncbi:hypothetical protein [Cryptosporidium parvum Iowa II]|uniref:Uncharacterized protein n=2 Tax=Cryptosporidium parvum TaxID=5807 RepID=Q5CQ24_CRYPI|nr:hypothetical protein [Cryptosporidium parvum Iowa II]EAK87587.1 hypothetical protein cgd5_4410 [Cryptosporidium parvum Iowa II]QOY41751.1 rRNA-processing protein Efg1 [Cryptosporidium parvum]WKS77972.1 hypothetical protein CPCDC_5g4410 [Cryptosporidium sp. 43IA8]WRK32463.1 rRNA-processing protein Efg1 [Cryptosporidium parvum]|eukprot:QOY41751.1 hypothetical protein CPATCC_002346 [Cryptosporidium parvum]